MMLTINDIKNKERNVKLLEMPDYLTFMDSTQENLDDTLKIRNAMAAYTNNSDLLLPKDIEGKRKAEYFIDLREQKKLKFKKIKWLYIHFPDKDINNNIIDMLFLISNDNNCGFDFSDCVKGDVLIFDNVEYIIIKKQYDYIKGNLKIYLDFYKVPKRRI